MEGQQDQALIELLERLDRSHREELERTRLQHAERFRRSELARIKAETKLEELQASLGEQREEPMRLLNRRTEETAVIRQSFDACLQEVKDESASLYQERDHQAQKVDELHARCLAFQAELTRYRCDLVETQSKLAAAYQSISFRLGNLLVNGLTSWRGAIGLPREILRLWRQRHARIDNGTVPLGKLSASAKTKAKTASAQPAETELDVERLYAEQGREAVEALIEHQLERPTEVAEALTRLARLVVGVESSEGIRLAQRANELDPRAYRQKWLGFMLFDAGNILGAHRQLSGLPAATRMKASEHNKARYIAGCARLLETPPVVPPPPEAPAYQVVPGRVLYVASSSRPYHTTGYTSRTHGIVKAIAEHGQDILCVTRPGYPADRPDGVAGVDHRYDVIEHDGVRYQALEGPHRRKRPLDEYLTESAEIIARKATEERSALIHAASNYEAALPALMAARQLGIPFVYEVRGLWEYTAASRLPGWEETERFALDKGLESLVVQHADRILTLTSALADELQKRGARPERISLAENAIDPQQFQPRQRNLELAGRLGLQDDDFVIGYAGSIVGYEGLDDLITAFGDLLPRQLRARLLIVGEGNALAGLRQQTQAAGLEERVSFTGRVSPELVPEYLSLVNAIVLPRKPFTVCELVSPLKPFEAMAMEIPLVVSDVAALREISHDGRTALVHQAGNPTDLAASLERLITEPDLAASLVQEARQLVNTRHTWAQVTEGIVECYQQSGGNENSIQAQAGRAEFKDAE